ncbi:Hypothetical predicted protein [Olea europaea subsp. europaea]|uniref:Uncharacterized protein n=1 Tax=Olea europaea subsp. europaea TaxID=158383 RepID=A0A8S0R111_OLEEU|nr:Hypothetical predicted protein [Olea europaea subsp. europaea]
MNHQFINSTTMNHQFTKINHCQSAKINTIHRTTTSSSTTTANRTLPLARRHHQRPLSPDRNNQKKPPKNANRKEGELQLRAATNLASPAFAVSVEQREERRKKWLERRKKEER